MSFYDEGVSVRWPEKTTGLLCSGGVPFIHLRLPSGGHRSPVTSLLRQLSERLRLFQLVQPFTGSDGVMVFPLPTHWARNGKFPA